MKTALEEVNSLRSFDDREQMVKSLAERKLANTKTSISFGNEKVRMSPLKKSLSVLCVNC